MQTRLKLQNKIAENRWLLLWGALWAALVWFLAGLVTHQEMWLPFVCTIIATYFMVELNNTNALIRIYSRMVSTAFLLLVTMMVFNFGNLHTFLIILCSALFYFEAYQTYQNRMAQGRLYFAFLAVSVASFFWVQALYFVPVLWYIVTAKLQSMSFRVFVASLLALITPYWFYVAYCIYFKDLHTFLNHFTPLEQFGELADISSWTHSQLITVSYLAVVSFIGIVHYLRNRQTDRIRTQMLYESFIIIDLLSWAFLILQPQHIHLLMGIIIVNTSPLIAHFIALTHTIWTNIVSQLLMLSLFATTIYNLWMLS